MQIKKQHKITAVVMAIAVLITTMSVMIASSFAQSDFVDFENPHKDWAESMGAQTVDLQKTSAKEVNISRAVTWSSGNEDVATVIRLSKDKTTATFHSAGIVMIAGGTDKGSINQEDFQVIDSSKPEAYRFTNPLGNELRLKKGATKTFDVDFKIDGKTVSNYKNVEWKTTNPNIATVELNSKGQAEVTAKQERGATAIFCELTDQWGAKRTIVGTIWVDITKDLYGPIGEDGDYYKPVGVPDHVYEIVDKDGNPKNDPPEYIYDPDGSIKEDEKLTEDEQTYPDLITDEDGNFYGKDKEDPEDDNHYLIKPDGSLDKDKPYDKETEGEDKPATSIQISNTGSITPLLIGDKVTAKAVLTPSDSTSTYTWSSSNTSVLTINENTGEITALKEGVSAVTVTTDNGESAMVNVTVNAPTILPTSVLIDPTSMSFTVNGSAKTATAIVYPSNATNKTVTWKSSNTAVATISASGSVTPKAAGTATITATTVNSKTDSITVTVKSETILPTSITVNPTSMNFTVGDSAKTATATVSPSNTTNKTVTWSSSNTNVATVNSSGSVTPISAGSTTITATTHNNKTATISVTVNHNGILSGSKVGDTADWLEIATNGEYSLIIRTEVSSYCSFGAYNSGDKYESSILRSEINDFYKDLDPNSALRKHAVISDVKNKKGTWDSLSAANGFSVPTSTLAGSTTNDVAFAPSYQEVANYISLKHNGTASPATAIANFNKAKTISGNDFGKTYTLCRTMGSSTHYAVNLTSGGDIGCSATAGTGASARPALWVKSSIFYY